MILHLRPRLYCPWENVALVDLQIKALRLHLRGGTDLMTRRPYPNKRYAVACRKQGRKAMDGIIVDTITTVDDLTCTTRWKVEDEGIVTHHVLYQLLDHDFDTASDSMLMWAGTHHWDGNWEHRYPEWAKGTSPNRAEPKMAVIPEQECLPVIPTQDIVDKNRNLIVSRHQTYAIPTIERERLLRKTASWNERTPSLDSVFVCPTKAAGAKKQ